jgi:anionic cell wall polymer biosynthesis LytR-Cps2A-Psr (LCP) family protein
MIKFLLIIFFVIYLFVKIGGFIMRTLFSGFVKNQQNAQQNQNTQYKKPSDGNVNIEYIPGSDKNKTTNKEGFKGGDYVDYEEV